eukprot:Transcript_10165.p3 GENE.Transcript_10165~~Transcript_10165.p3  ORF type:complete len:337 (-),score=122.89 Transcript_10165:177-1187(-)
MQFVVQVVLMLLRGAPRPVGGGELFGGAVARGSLGMDAGACRLAAWLALEGGGYERVAPQQASRPHPAWLALYHAQYEQAPSPSCGLDLVGTERSLYLPRRPLARGDSGSLHDALAPLDRLLRERRVTTGDGSAGRSVEVHLPFGVTQHGGPRSAGCSLWYPQWLAARVPGGIPEAQTFSLLPVREAAPSIAAFAVNTRWATSGGAGAGAGSGAMAVDGGEGGEGSVGDGEGGDEGGGAAADDEVDDGEGGGAGVEDDDDDGEGGGGGGGSWGSWGFGEVESYGDFDPGAGEYHAPYTAGVPPGRLVLVPQGHGRLSLVLVLAGGRSLLIRKLYCC